MNWAQRTAVVSACVVTSAVSTACGTAGPASLARSGIRGRTVVGPSCPVAGTGHRCHPKPIRALLRVMNQKGSVLRRIQTDEHGRFDASLAPGHYVVVATSAQQHAGLPRPARKQVVVHEGQVRIIALRLDSGIR